MPPYLISAPDHFWTHTNHLCGILGTNRWTRTVLSEHRTVCVPCWLLQPWALLAMILRKVQQIKSKCCLFYALNFFCWTSLGSYVCRSEQNLLTVNSSTENSLCYLVYAWANIAISVVMLGVNKGWVCTVYLRLNYSCKLLEYVMNLRAYPMIFTDYNTVRFSCLITVKRLSVFH